MKLIRVAGRGSGLVLKAQRQINLLNWHHFFLCLTWLQGKKICTALIMFFRKRNNAVDITITMSDDKYSHQVILYHIFWSLSYFYFLRTYNGNNFENICTLHWLTFFFNHYRVFKKCTIYFILCFTFCLWVFINSFHKLLPACAF